MMAKRVQREAPKADTNENDYTALIRQAALRTRAAVPNGYQTGDAECSLPRYMNDYERQQAANSLKRIVLPNGLDKPPGLDFLSSTASSFSDWESNNLHVESRKRGFPDVENTTNGKEQELSAFIARHGPLSFSEEF